jgi:phosphatidylethanolamine/phosphatidyl-N-methylethanolamine N-methyltransferase
MSITRLRKIYDSYSSFYDVLFGRVFQEGRTHSAAIVNENAAYKAQVLEVGLGTGLSLPLYREDLNITGIDISEKMLQKARKRIEVNDIKTNIEICTMDASELKFANSSFDFVVAMYVASVVPDLNKFLQEISRVCKTYGEIIIVNHFTSENKFLRSVEKKLAGLESLVGFNSNVSTDAILNYEKFKLVASQDINLFGYWKLLHLRKI